MGAHLHIVAVDRRATAAGVVACCLESHTQRVAAATPGSRHGPWPSRAVPPVTVRRYGGTAMVKIFSVSARAALAHVIDPLARGLLRIGVTPNAVTVAGTVGVLIGALVFGARGYLITGLVIVTLSALTDLLDGTMARMR